MLLLIDASRQARRSWQLIATAAASTAVSGRTVTAPVAAGTTAVVAMATATATTVTVASGAAAAPVTTAVALALLAVLSPAPFAAPAGITGIIALTND